MKALSVHGSYRLSIVERVVCSAVIGPWNLECTLAYSDEFRTLTASLADDGSPWASFFDPSKWQLLTPDSVQLFNENAQWASANNRTHVAIVSIEFSLEEWLRDRMLENTQVESRFFHNRQDAWNWLQELGFCEKAPLLMQK